MKNIFVLIAAMMVSGTAFAVTFEDAQVLACQEAARVDFQFDSTCEDDFYKAEKVTNDYFIFAGLDASGDCGIKVAIDRVTGAAQSKVSCY